MLKQLIEKRYSEIKKYSLLVLCYVGLDIGMLCVCNLAVVSLFGGNPEFRLFLLFLVLVLYVLILLNISAKKSARMIEGIVNDFRKRIIERVMAAELQSFENIGPAGIYNILTRETQVISLIANRFIQITRVMVVTTGYVVILFFVYRPAFLTVLICLVLGIAIYVYMIRLARKQITLAREKEEALFNSIEALLYGFKELRINDRKNEDFFNEAFIEKSAENRKSRVRAENYFAVANVIAGFFQYAVFFPVIFILPLIDNVPALGLMLTINLLIFTPFDVLKEGIPYLVRAGVSIDRIFAFEKEIANITIEKSEIGSDVVSELGEAYEDFSEIAYENICFDYTDSEGTTVFSLNNIDLTVKKGEIIFIVGGNGSGKSTFLKIMAGLYFPLSGSVKIDEEPIEILPFRHLFTTIFSDFHLFDRLYGIEEVDPEKVIHWLDIMELTDTLQFTDNRFSTLDLSTGQKKRLAVIASVMDDKPVYLFDEWAADQSPQFRDYFYHKLLPLFKAQGKTIIAVSHDDRYFDAADRVIELEYGRIRQD